jgi:glutamine amidotransferase
VSAGASVVVADLGSGNLRSVEKALAAVGARVAISADADAVARADKLVVPGQGAFGACAAGLDGGGGAMRQAVRGFIDAGRPFFGICIGMQLLFESSEENPDAPGLAVLPGRVRRFADRPGLKIPHMGWNRTQRGPAAAGGPAATVPDGSCFYFVHSYFPDPARAEDVALSSEHGVGFCAAVGRDNVFGC